VACRDHADDVGDVQNDDRYGKTSALLPVRTSIPYGLIDGADLDLLMVNFQKTDRVRHFKAIIDRAG
jgi:hypothetical protein